MRQIKFRVYDKLVNKMLDVKQITYSLSGKNMGVTSVLPIYKGDWKVGEQSRPLLTGEYELMQFTGLLDKSGKEIFESDFLRWEDRNPPKEETTTHQVGKVYWGESGVWMVELDDDWKFPLGENLDDTFEVIGNIYESNL